MNQRLDWHSFENSLKTDARFLNGMAANLLTSIFDSIDELKTGEGRPLVVDAGPGTDFHSFYRARIFQSGHKLEAALSRPDIHLGPPPARLAAAGRMNARGISVFYGASNQKAAVAEVRPPVGAQIAVAKFEIIRKLRLLDLTAFSDVRVTESLADFGLAGRLEQAVFLRSLTERVSRPVMRDDDPFEYLATQAIVDFLATDPSPIDGIMFPSLQAPGNSFNIILFHKAARVVPINVPAGTAISASTGRWTEEGWVEDYEVFEKVPSFQRVDKKDEQEPELPGFAAVAESAPPEPRDADWRGDSLCVVPESVEVHRVKCVEFATDRFKVKRRRREERTNVHFGQVANSAIEAKPDAADSGGAR
jgi:RES domain-containing protein